MLARHIISCSPCPALSHKYIDEPSTPKDSSALDPLRILFGFHLGLADQNKPGKEASQPSKGGWLEGDAKRLEPSTEDSMRATPGVPPLKLLTGRKAGFKKLRG